MSQGRKCYKYGVLDCPSLLDTTSCAVKCFFFALSFFLLLVTEDNRVQGSQSSENIFCANGKIRHFATFSLI